MKGFLFRLVAALALVVSAGAQGWPPRNGATLPATCTVGETFFLTASGTTKYHECTATNTWSSVADQATGGAGVPTGGIILVISGSCPTGYAEETSLAGKFLVGTTVAAGDVGTGAGSDTITAVLNHTHPVTDPGHGHVQNAHSHTQDAHTHTQNSHNHTQDPHTHTLTGGATDDTSAPFPGPDAANAATVFATTGIQAATATNQAATAVNQNATATNQAATAVNQSATTGVTTANPAGGVASIDNRPAFVKVIFCRKT